MAIVRILKSAKGFDGVGYNEGRCRKNEATLIAKNNFGSAGALMDDETYLNKWSSSNTRIKNKQLHVVISAKGNNMSEDELKKLGIDWLNKMGYGDNPYLIYFHKHNDNNHIHIITSRVNKEGKKINDKFEKERAVLYLNELQGIDNEKKCNRIIKDLAGYSFSTVYQFAELLRMAGFNVYVKDGGIKCKYGETIIKLEKDWIKEKSEKNRKVIDLNYKKKLQGLIFKYAAQLSPENFARFMKENFGLQFIYYGKNNTINGYTIVDYNTKSVFKGSEVFSLNRLKELLELPENRSFEIDLYLNEMFSKNKFLTTHELNEYLKTELGYNIINGRYQKIGSQEQIPANEKFIKRLAYNDRLIKAVISFKPQDELQCSILASLYKLRVDDINLVSAYYKSSVNVNVDYYQNLIDTALLENKSLRTVLSMNNIAVVFKDEQFVLVDSRNGCMVNSEMLDIDMDEINNNIDTYKVRYLTGDVELDNLPTEEEEYYTLDIPLFTGTGLFYTGGGGGGSSNRKRKKKKSD